MTKNQKRLALRIALALRQSPQRDRIGRVLGARCHYCGNDFALRHLTFDHLVRRRDGGRLSQDNTVLACFLCNIAREGPVASHKGALHRQRQLLGLT